MNKSSSCCICSKDPSSYKCPRCSLPYCSVACCKVHKESCNEPVKDVITDSYSNTPNNIFTNTTPTTTIITPTIATSQRLKDFLSANPYLHTQLPVLLARIDRHELTATATTGGNQLARDLARRERVAEVLGEALETDPKVAELYKLLQEEGLLD